MREQYDEYKKIVDDHLMDYMVSVDPFSQTLLEAMEYSLMAGGKRLRPVLLLSSCEFAGGDSYAALPYACALEYIHTYSLIHDDLPCMDDDDLRRGKPTNHVIYGPGIATLAGDGLLNTAFEIMNRDLFFYFDKPDELKRRIRASHAIAKGAGVKGMIAGQVADIEAESGQCSSEMLEHIHRNKTGALICAAVEAGLYLGGADQDMMNDMTIYAECLGMAFQVADDILDVVGDEKELGKKTGEDQEHQKLTYVSMYGLDASRERLHELTNRAVEVIAPYYDNAEFFRDLVLKLEKRTK